MSVFPAAPIRHLMSIMNLGGAARFMINVRSAAVGACCDPVSLAAMDAELRGGLLLGRRVPDGGTAVIEYPGHVGVDLETFIKNPLHAGNGPIPTDGRS